MALWLVILIFVIVLIIAAIPLHFSVSFLGGDSSILKAIITNGLVGLAGALIQSFVPSFGTLVYVIAVLLIYKFMFNIGWIRAVLVWILQVIISVVLLMLLMFLGVLAL